MFGKIKDLYKLKSQADQLKNLLKDVIIEREKGGIKIAFNGNLEMTKILFSDNAKPDESSQIIVQLVNECIKEAQQEMVKKMNELNGGFSPMV